MRELSTGTRRVVDLACVLAHRPSVVLLDEPSSGIAQREAEALGPLLLRIRDALGASLLVIEHDMPLLTGGRRPADRHRPGPRHRDGPAADVLHDPEVVASYLGTRPRHRHSFRSNGSRRDRPDHPVTAKVGAVDVTARGRAAAGRVASRRYGPVVAIVVVVAMIAAIVVPEPRFVDAPSTGANAPVATSSADAAASLKQAVSFSEAKAAGTVDSIDWGSRCDIKTGKLALPELLRRRVLRAVPWQQRRRDRDRRDRDGDQGRRSTSRRRRPGPQLHPQRDQGSTTNAQTTATMRDWVKFYNHFYETYGRTVEMVPFTATGLAADPISAPRRCRHDRHEHQAVRGVGRADPDAGLRR